VSAEDPAGDAAEQVAAASMRLREIAERLGAADLADEEAEDLAREAADLVGRASNEIERALRDDSTEA
jgi:hypothetical protein